MKKLTAMILGALAALPAFAQSVEQNQFGKTADGKTVTEFVLKNKSGMQVRAMDFGATITSILAPDRYGKFADVVLGYDTLAEYEKGGYFGPVVGRFGNRIKRGEFTLDGVKYKVDCNEGRNSLHGGKKGFDKQVWQASTSVSGSGATVKFTLVSPDGDMGFPGKLTAVVSYTLTNDNTLELAYEVSTDKPTVQNLTNHAFFNLAGEGSGTILNHEFLINADFFVPIDSESIPTGGLRKVKDTPFDFTKSRLIGSRIDAADTQLENGGGYDHCWVLNRKTPSDMEFAARLHDSVSGRTLLVYTTEPGMQFYSGNFMKGDKGKGGKEYHFRNALVIETEHFPDAPNNPDFPSTRLDPDKVYKSKTIYMFRAQ